MIYSPPHKRFAVRLTGSSSTGCEVRFSLDQTICCVLFQISMIDAGKYTVMLNRVMCTFHWLILILPCTWAINAQAAGEKHALIIGNSQYGADSLKNPVNDAQDMAEALAGLGYHIHGGSAFLNTDGAQLSKAVTSFAEQLPTGATALVFYAGHGVSWQGDNYLLPTDARVLDVDTIQNEAVSLQAIVKELADANPKGSNVFLLDACRESPFSELLGGNMGLNRIYTLPHGTFIGYAAQEGRVASDGEGRNGRYTAALLEALKEYSHFAIAEFHREVRSMVYRASRLTGETQLPMEEVTVTARLCFGSCDITFEVPTQTTIAQAEPEMSEVVDKPAQRRRTLLYTVLGVVLVGLLVSQDDDGESQDSVIINLIPPAQ